MAWFGDTFGDGLSSLKGQITKITKEVLSEDPLASTSFEGRIKELEEECARLQKVTKKLEIENARLKENMGFELSDDQIQAMCQLENQLAEVIAEKDSLSKTLEDIDLDHQKEIDVLIKDRDALREMVKNTTVTGHTNNLAADTAMVQELTAAIQQLQLQNDILFAEGKSKDQELLQCLSDADRLRKTVAALELKIDQYPLGEMAKRTAVTNHTNHLAMVEELNADMQQLQLQNEIIFEEGKSKDQELLQCHNDAELLRNTVSELELKIKRLSAERLQADGNIENASEQVRHLENIMKENQFVIEALKSDNDLMKRNIEILECKISDNDSRYKDSVDKFECCKMENCCLLDKLEKAINQCKELEENAVVFSVEKSRLEEEFQVLQARNSEKEKLLAKVQSETDDLKNLEEKCYDLEVSMKSLQAAAHTSEEKTRALMKENSELKNNLEKVQNMFESMPPSNELENKLQEAESIINSLMQENERTEEIKVSFDNLMIENSELQQRVASLEENAAARLEAVQIKNLELKKQMEDAAEKWKNRLEALTVDNSGLISLKNEHVTVIQGLTQEKITLENKVKENSAHLDNMILENEELNRELANKTISLDQLQDENADLKIKLEGKETADVIRPEIDSISAENHELKEKLQKLETSASAENRELKEKLQKLEALVARTEERESLVSGTLCLEIRKLKGLVSRIRREFLRSPDPATETDPDKEHHTGEDVMIQSQTDDVKRLQQDVSQMTEIIKMIDQGLTTIYQDKSRMEKELSVLKSVAAKTEQELSIAVKAKHQLESNVQEWALAVSNRDEALRDLTTAKINLETDLRTVQNEKDNLLKLNVAQTEEIKKIEMDRESVEDRLRQAELSSEEWKKRLEELQVLYQNEAKHFEELLKKKDECIAELTRDAPTKSVENGQVPEESLGQDLETRVKRIESINEGAEKRPEITEVEDQVTRLLDENTDLKMLVKQLRENIFVMNTRVPEIASELHQHRRSHSQVEDHKTEMEVEQARYQSLLVEHQNLKETEVNLRREVDRLRAHLVEVEEHYTEEAMTAEAQLTEYRSKLGVAEEQLRSSSNVYKSANVRSTQHLEALQTQIHLMDVQRKDLQNKLSEAEDYSQKQAAALASLQLVLEQFQLDKQRELQAAEERHQHQIDIERRHAIELENTIKSLDLQLTEAKNGLKAALRLGEQLEKKTQVINELEGNLKRTQADLSSAESKLASIHQSTSGKIDKSLVKNLVVGYLGAQGDHKTQALKILSSVLELSREERARVGVEGQGGWLNHLLYPSSSFAPPTESLSQAFVRFLESESTPQPQLKLLAETRPNETIPRRAPLLLSDLVLPPVTPTEVSDSGLREVLRDS